MNHYLTQYPVRKEGIVALWKGAMPAVTTGVVENAVVFSANGVLHGIFCEPGEVMLYPVIIFIIHGPYKSGMC